MATSDIEPKTSPLPVPERLPVALLTLFLTALEIGAVAFGFAMLHKIKAVVVKRQWMSEEEVNEGVALVQLYPGPIMVDLVAYVGYKLRGVPGALTATLGFVLPSFASMLVLSAAYFALGTLAWSHLLFLGLDALVIGIIVHATLDVAQRTLTGRLEAAIALAAFIALQFDLNAFLIVLLALVSGAWLLRPAGAQDQARVPPTRRRRPVSIRRSAALAAVVAGAENVSRSCCHTWSVLLLSG
jgi:chromate transporter